jgi:hypothetical protein
MRRVLLVGLAVAIAALAGCVDIPPDPLQLDRNLLTVDNHTSSDWNNVEIWINRYYRVAVPRIAARSRFQVPLDAFVSGYSQRFDIHHAVIKDLQLTAKEPDGTPVLIKRESSTGLAALGSKGKQ